jgi:hypothetical protein
MWTCSWRGYNIWSSTGPKRSDATSTFGQGKTVVVPGFRGIDVFRDDLRWAPVFGKSGLCFVLPEDPHPFFDEQGLSEDGKKILKAMNEGDLFVIIKGLDPDQTKALLTKVRKPMFVLVKDIPEKEILDMAKTNESAGGFLGG